MDPIISVILRFKCRLHSWVFFYLSCTKSAMLKFKNWLVIFLNSIQKLKWRMPTASLNLTRKRWKTNTVNIPFGWINVLSNGNERRIKKKVKHLKKWFVSLVFVQKCNLIVLTWLTGVVMFCCISSWFRYTWHRELQFINLMMQFFLTCFIWSAACNEVHQKDAISHILWYSDWLHNTTSARNNIFVTNHDTTSCGRSIM